MEGKDGLIMSNEVSIQYGIEFRIDRKKLEMVSEYLEKDKNKNTYYINRKTTYLSLGELLLDFLDINLDQENELFLFLKKYGISCVKDINLSQTANNILNNCGEYSRGRYSKIMHSVWKESQAYLKEAQVEYFKALSFLDIDKEHLSELSPSEKLFMLSLKKHIHIPKILNYASTIKETTSYLTKGKQHGVEVLMEVLANNTMDEYTLADKLKESGIGSYSYYETDSIFNVFNKELEELIKLNVKARRCHYCGKYILSYNSRSDKFFCERIPKGETKPCSKIGAQKNFIEKLQSDPIEEIFRKACKRVNGQCNKKPSLESEEKYKLFYNEAFMRKEEVKKGLLSLDNYIQWIDKASRIRAKKGGD